MVKGEMEAKGPSCCHFACAFTYLPRYVKGNRIINWKVLSYSAISPVLSS